MTKRRKPVEPDERAIRVATDIVKNFYFNNYTRNDVMRAARRIAKEYGTDGVEDKR